MPTVKVYRHGTTAGVAPSKNDHLRGLRGDVGGWSSSSTRSNLRFLYSVIETALTGVGYGITLTVRDCPPSHEDWHKARRAFTERLRRMGMIRMHWVTEWQRRGVPHLHGALWFPEGVSMTAEVIRHWLDVSKRYGTNPRAQAVLPITDSVGWFQYLSKHAARGLSHYQRSPENIPDGWKKTGRMWGHLGDWPVHEAMVFGTSSEGFWRLRRMYRGWRIADARQDRSRPNMSLLKRLKLEAVRCRRITQARRALTCTDPRFSAVRGISEWIPEGVLIAMLLGLISQGLKVEQTD